MDPIMQLLTRLRNMEEFAALGQFLFCFGAEALALPEFDIDDLERELLAGVSELVQNIKMALLRTVSSHRGLVPDQFEEYARRQYLKRKPEANPFGDDPECAKFVDLDIFQRVQVLHQLSIWAFAHPERIRDKMKDNDEKEQVSWRVEPCGFNGKGVAYFILDDNRLYQQTPRKAPADPPVQKTKPRKRRRTAAARNFEADEADTDTDGGGEWSCICVTLQDWETIINSFKGSKNADEIALCHYFENDVLPIIREAWLSKEKQRLLEEAVANRKRSSRIDAKLSRRREEEAKAADQRRIAEEEERAKRRQQQMVQRERDRETRMRTRERKLKERELAIQSTTGSGDDSSGSRRSTRRSRKATEEPGKRSTDEEWTFDCICGLYGVNYVSVLPNLNHPAAHIVKEDGTEIIACDSCDVWQHVRCQKLPPGFENGEFICDLCHKRRDAALGMEGERRAVNSTTSPQLHPSAHPISIKLRLGPSSPTKLHYRPVEAKADSHEDSSPELIWVPTESGALIQAAETVVGAQPNGDSSKPVGQNATGTSPHPATASSGAIETPR